MENQENPLSPEMLEELKNSYLRSGPEKIRALEEAFHKCEQTPSETSYKEMRRLIHTLAGSAGTFGLPEISRLCKIEDERLKAFLEKYKGANLLDLAATKELIVKLKEMFKT